MVTFGAIATPRVGPAPALGWWFHGTVFSEPLAGMGEEELPKI